MAFVWTDDPITTASKTIVKAVHINEVHNDVDTDRVSVGLAKYDWVKYGSVLNVSKGDLVKAIDFSTAATALTEAWDANCPTHNSAANNPVYSSHKAAVNITNQATHMNIPHFSNHKASNFSSNKATPHYSANFTSAYAAEP